MRLPGKKSPFQSFPTKSHIIQEASRDIIAHQSSGSIVFTASMSGHIVNTPQPHPAYAVSKAGVLHLTRSLAAEWVGHRIRVNSISPGIMNTRLSGGPAQAELRRLWMERSPLGFGDPEDLTGAVVLLCSPAGKFMTGTDLVIDGEFDLLQQAGNRLREARWLHNLLVNDLYVCCKFIQLIVLDANASPRQSTYFLKVSHTWRL